MLERLHRHPLILYTPSYYLCCPPSQSKQVLITSSWSACGNISVKTSAACNRPTGCRLVCRMASNFKSTDVPCVYCADLCVGGTRMRSPMKPDFRFQVRGQSLKTPNLHGLTDKTITRDVGLSNMANTKTIHGNKIQRLK